uniref:Uncharacterized protein n=1 Tax=Ferret systemic coronavirus TaxID=742314 RepID=D3XGJ1_9ALPC|nr:truncated hypothetical protein [Ferret systemic coronavirus]
MSFSLITIFSGKQL